MLQLRLPTWDKPAVAPINREERQQHENQHGRACQDHDQKEIWPFYFFGSWWAVINHEMWDAANGLQDHFIWLRSSAFAKVPIPQPFKTNGILSLASQSAPRAA
jgi:hypothetical protein